MRPIDADALEKDYRRQFDAVYKNIRDTVLPSDFYIERQAAYNKEIVRRDMEAFCEFLHSRPAIDAEPVTYCNMCKHYETDTGYCQYHGHGMHWDDFCSRGAKMDK